MSKYLKTIIDIKIEDKAILDIFDLKSSQIESNRKFFT